MKLLDKIKNTFFEEEYIEVEEPTPVVARKVEPTISPVKNEEKVTDSFEKTTEEKVVQGKRADIEKEVVQPEKKLPYFEDDDFIDDTIPKNSNVSNPPKKLYGQDADKLYNSIHYNNTNTNSKPYTTPTKEAFKPTPIISPIYGVLDKNYHKEEVIDKKTSSSYVSRKNVDLDSIRKKAYGNLDSFEQEEIEQENNNELENNLLYDMTSEHTKPVVEGVTLADAEEYFEDLGLEYNIDYKDNRYEKATGRRVRTVREESTEDKSDDPEEETNLEDNLFDLIDSEYGDEEEE